MPPELKGDYCITINFKKDSTNPERVFQAMAELIKSFQKLDNALVDSIDSGIEPVVLLEDIEVGSLKTWLKTILKNIPDDSLMNMEWKQVIGQYLVKAKYILLNKLENKTTITNAKEIEDIQFEMLQAAEETNIKQFPSYSPIQTKKLISGIVDINKSLQYLDKEDKVSFQAGNKPEVSFNLHLDISPDTLEDLLTYESIENEVTMILKVNKPDYLGDSMWTFKHEQRTINAKITHKDWLIQFQERKVDVRPGDSLKCRVNVVVKYGKDMNVIKTVYEVKEVLQTINFDEKGRQLLFPE